MYERTIRQTKSGPNSYILHPPQLRADNPAGHDRFPPKNYPSVFCQFVVFTYNK